MNLRGAKDNPLDLIVIGGGINGTGIARDATLRGMRVALFEARDFSTGATWASSGMIHGGLRYLEQDPDVTRLACLDSGFIQKIAPNLIFRIPFLLPWATGRAAKLVFDLAEIYFEAYDRYQPLKRGLPHTRLTPEEIRALEPGIVGDFLGGLTMDEWGIDAARLTVLAAVDAQERGARVESYVRVEKLLRNETGRVIGVRTRDRLSGLESDVFARATINATGPWSMRFAKSQNIESVRVRPGKGVHLILAGRLTNYAIIAKAIDGREIFVCPQQNTSIIGTTDDDYFGDLEDIPVLEDEVEYLLSAMESVFPSIRQYPIIGTTVGCRATLHEYGKYEDRLSREHQVFDHSREGSPGFYSIAGGKLASYRIMSEEAVDIIAASLGVSAKCSTHQVALPGGESHDVTLDQFRELGVDGVTAGRILYRHGSRSERILELMRENRRWTGVVDPGEPVTEAELRYCIRNENVRVLDDLKRRCRLGVGVDGGSRGAARAAQIFCEEKELAPSDFPHVTREFLLERWKDRRGIAYTGVLREAMTQSWSALSAQLGRPMPDVQ